jgi:glycerol kinase
VDAVRAQEAAAGKKVSSLKADGGAVANTWLMQFQADVLGAPVIVPQVAETTALGAAYLAGIATGLWTADQVREMWREAAAYEPAMPESKREELMGRWAEAVTRARGWSRA